MIKELLTKLKMRGALSALDDLAGLKDRDQYLIGLLKAEAIHRENRACKRRLSLAKFPIDKEWTDIDKTLNPMIDFAALEAIGEEELITKRNNLCLMGKQGTGKTHSLIAIGRKLCRKGITTSFFTACGLVNLLEEAKASNTLSKLMRTLIKPQVLIIDELGFIPFSENGGRLLFDVFASRYERGSIAVSTNLSFEKWVQVFGSIELTAALIDRFTHRCLIYDFDGDSIRLRQAKERQKNAVKALLK